MKRKFFNPFGYSKGANAIHAFACFKEDGEEAALLEKIEAKSKKLIEDADKAHAAELKSLTDKLKDLEEKSKEVKNPADYEALKKEHVTLMAEVKALNEKPKLVEEKRHRTLGAAILAAFEEKAAEIKSIVESGGKQKETLSIEVKSAVVMSDEATIGAGSTQVTLTDNTGKISVIRQREERYLANVSVGSMSGNRALWIEETDQQGTPIMIGEGDGKTQLSVLYVEKTESVKKCAVYGKVTTELLADLPQLVSYIQNNLMKRMDLKIEDELLNGTGVGDELKGIDAYATDFTGGANALSIVDPNEFDVIESIALQVKEAYGIPTALFVHPSTVSKMKLIKDTTGRPIWKDYVTVGGNMNISGLNIIETTAMTAGDFIGGDTSVINVLNRSSLGIQIGLDGNDFTQNKKTMLVEKRLVQFVSANDTAVLVKGDFATAKTAITSNL